MLLLATVTLLAFALALATAPLARCAYGQVGRMPASSRVTIYVGTAGVWVVALAGALGVAMLVDPLWVPCAILASCVVGMLALAIFTTSAKDEQERLRSALARMGASGPFHEQRLAVRLRAWVMTREHNGVMARAVRVLVPALMVVVVAIRWFFEGVDW